LIATVGHEPEGSQRMMKIGKRCAYLLSASSEAERLKGSGATIARATV
jgi:hypothetical protein